MNSWLRLVFHLVAGTALGTMIFFTAIVAEQVFASLPLDSAGDVLANIFPPYYTLTTLLCIVALIACWLLTQNRHGWWVWLARWSLLATTVFMAVGWLVLLPIMNRLRLAIPSFTGPQTPAIMRFFMFHGLSMGLNLLSGLLLAFAIGIIAVISTRKDDLT